MWIVSSFPFYFHALFYVYVKVAAVRRKADSSYRKYQANRRKEASCFTFPEKPSIILGNGILNPVTFI